MIIWPADYSVEAVRNRPRGSVPSRLCVKFQISYAVGKFSAQSSPVKATQAYSRPPGGPIKKGLSNYVEKVSNRWQDEACDNSKLPDLISKNPRLACTNSRNWLPQSKIFYWSEFFMNQTMTKIVMTTTATMKQPSALDSVPPVEW